MIETGGGQGRIAKSVRRPELAALTESACLRAGPLGHLSAAELERLIAHARIETYRPRREIYLKGGEGRGLMLVLQGGVRLGIQATDGRQLAVAVVEPGEVFGELELFDGGERATAATAIGNCALLVVDRRDFLPLLRDNPELGLRLAAVLARRMRRLLEQAEDALFLHRRTRLAKKLLQLVREQGQPTEGGISLPMRLRQRELGNLLGLSRESINKQLSSWHRAGVIRCERGAVTVVDPATLEAYVEMG